MADRIWCVMGRLSSMCRNILQGWHDSPLTARGAPSRRWRRARRLRARGVTFDHVYSSPLGRARRTAELIVGEGRSIELVDDLREWHLGSLEGTSNRDMPPQPWGDYPVKPLVVSRSAAPGRIVAALSRIIARPRHDCVLAVSPALLARSFLST